MIGYEYFNCEVDIVCIVGGKFLEKIFVLIGECKDRGGKCGIVGFGGFIDVNDIDNFKWIVDFFFCDRFNVYIFLVKLIVFMVEEVELVKMLNI